MVKDCRICSKSGQLSEEWCHERHCSDRIAELEAQLQTTQARIAELEAHRVQSAYRIADLMGLLREAQRWMGTWYGKDMTARIDAALR